MLFFPIGLLVIVASYICQIFFPKCRAALPVLAGIMCHVHVILHADVIAAHVTVARPLAVTARIHP